MINMRYVDKEFFLQCLGIMVFVSTKLPVLLILLFKKRPKTENILRYLFMLETLVGRTESSYFYYTVGGVKWLTKIAVQCFIMDFESWILVWYILLFLNVYICNYTSAYDIGL